MINLIRLAIFVVTSLAYFVPLRVVLQGRRHFEVFIGMGHLLTGVMYNLSKALDMNVVLEEKQWHAMNNIFGVTYGMLLLVHMQANRSEGFDMFLRYLAYFTVWVAQEKDHYWDARYTAIVSGIFIVTTFLKWVWLGQMPPYNWGNVFKGLLILAGTVLCFVASQVEEYDVYGVLHGVANAGGAWSLMYLWQAVPMNRYKKRETLLPHTYY
eukprot:TRINITY_DN3978_c0_g1_i1.p3 TRINITY_DN3978_c0_g1~~TRINITY_DN3978_c0_g1_i1.p3  ORF type:complete len:211 (+),score=70.62 TRINITY_DN3978_c0_g1_i1:661-1293(+)